MDNYEIFRRMLDAHPAGAPPSPAIDTILRILFSNDCGSTVTCSSIRKKYNC